jgi:hypothetical protein
MEESGHANSTAAAIGPTHRVFVSQRIAHPLQSVAFSPHPGPSVYRYLGNPLRIRIGSLAELNT